MLVAPDGMYLIDWDTALPSLPERDIWMLETGDGTVAEHYHQVTGTAVDPANLELFRLLWDLVEIAEYTRVFRSVHADDANTVQSWKDFQRYIRLEASWPHLLADRDVGR